MNDRNFEAQVMSITDDFVKMTLHRNQDILFLNEESDSRRNFGSTKKNRPTIKFFVFEISFYLKILTVLSYKISNMILE